MGVTIGSFPIQINGETCTIQLHCYKNFADEGEYELTFQDGILISAIKYG